MSKCNVIYPPKPFDFKQPAEPPVIFLAGSIDMGEAEDWQTKIIETLDDVPCVVLNPRRKDWDKSWKQEIENPKFREQVEWELKGLEQATFIALCLTAESKAPISLLELGLHVIGRRMLVFCPKEYWRKGNVDVVCHRYGIPVHEDFDEFCRSVKARALETIAGTHEPMLLPAGTVQDQKKHFIVASDRVAWRIMARQFIVGLRQDWVNWEGLKAWNVYLDGKQIGTEYFAEGNYESDVKNQLVRGKKRYNPRIVVKRASASIRWKKEDPEDPDCPWISEDGRWELEPLFWGRTRPQGWAINDKTKGTRKTTSLPLSSVKADVQRQVDKESAMNAGETIKTAETNIRRGDICMVNMGEVRRLSADMDPSGNWAKVVAQTVRSGGGRVKVTEVVWTPSRDYAMCVADHPMGGVMGAAEIPLSALKKVTTAAAQNTGAAQVREGDICTVSLSTAAAYGVEGHQMRILRDVVRQGGGKVLVEEVKTYQNGDLAMVVSYDNPVSALVGGVQVPCMALRVVGHKAAEIDARVQAIASKIAADDDITLKDMDERAAQLRADLEKNGWQEKEIGFYYLSQFPHIFVDTNGVVAGILSIYQEYPFEEYARTYQQVLSALRSRYSKFARWVDNTEALKKSWKQYKGRGVHFQDDHVFVNSKHPDVAVSTTILDGKIHLHSIADGQYREWEQLAVVDSFRELEPGLARLGR